jgi:BolA protein
LGWNERGDFMSERAKRMEAALRVAFAPTALEIIDQSALHAGHAGAAPGGETHYLIIITADNFIGMNRLMRSRAVHEALAPEFRLGLHALSLRLRAPNEA